MVNDDNLTIDSKYDVPLTEKERLKHRVNTSNNVEKLFSVIDEYQNYVPKNATNSITDVVFREIIQSSRGQLNNQIDVDDAFNILCRECNKRQIPTAILRRLRDVRKEIYKNAQENIDINKSNKNIKKEYIEDEEDEIYIRTSFIEEDNTLYEQVKGLRFVYYDNGFKHKKFINTKLGKIYPCIGEEEIREVVILPDGPAPYESTISLVNEIKQLIHQWMDISPEYEILAAWYILLTWVYDKVNTIVYLRALGDTGTGKSRFLNVIGRLCYKPIIGSGGVTVAAVKRIIDKWKGTLIIDEGDFKDSDEKNELIKLFNLGFEKHNSMFNCDKNDPSKMEFFNPYCPKILATRRQFEDIALEARCLTHIMFQTTREDIPVILPESFFKQQALLRNKLLKFRFDYYHQIDIELSLKINMGMIEPRIRQAINCFLPLIIKDTVAFESFKEFVILYNKQVIDERMISYDGQIINVIADFIVKHEFNITSQMISDKISETGFKTSSRTVGKHLKQLGLGVVLKRNGEIVHKIVPVNKKLIDIFKRYISDDNLLETVCNDVTKVTLYTSTPSIKQTTTTGYNIKNDAVTVHDTVVTFVTRYKIDSQELYSKKELFDYIHSIIDAEPHVLVDDLYQIFNELCHPLIDDIISDLKTKGEIFEHQPGKLMKL